MQGSSHGFPLKRPRKPFEENVNDSLEAGDSWLHRWCRNTSVPTTVVHDAMLDGYTEDPQQILSKVTKQRASHWGCCRERDVDESSLLYNNSWCST